MTSAREEWQGLAAELQALAAEIAVLGTEVAELIDQLPWGMQKKIVTPDMVETLVNVAQQPQVFDELVRLGNWPVDEESFRLTLATVTRWSPPPGCPAACCSACATGSRNCCPAPASVN